MSRPTPTARPFSPRPPGQDAPRTPPGLSRLLHRTTQLLTSLLIATTLTLPVAPAHAAEPASGTSTFVPRRMEPAPKEFAGVGVDEKMNSRLPLELSFYNERGDIVTLGSLFTNGKPVILQLGYFGCPKLCGQVATSTVESLSQVDLSLGKDFNLLYVSIDPTERPELARESKKSYILRYTANGKHDVNAAINGWHFLTARGKEAEFLAKSVGFNYRWIESSQQYSHPAVLILITPDGTVSRYLYGAAFDPKVMRLSLVDASAGKVGSIMDQIIMFCFHFDPNTGTYSLAAMRMMRLAGIASVLALGTGVGLMVLKGRKLRSTTDNNPPPTRGLSSVLSRPPPPNN